MPENEFEKGVKQVMDNFNILPGSGVWQHVAVAVQQQKKRRQQIFIMAFLSGCFLLSFLFLADVKNDTFRFVNNTAANAIAIANAPKDIATIHGLFIAPKPSDATSSLKKYIAARPSPSAKKRRALANEDDGPKQLALNHKTKRLTSNKKIITIGKATVENSRQADNNMDTLNPTTGKENEVTISQKTSEANIDDNIIKKDSVSKSADTLHQPVVANNPKKLDDKQQKKKWKTGINLAGGIAATSSHFFSRAYQNYSNVYSSPSNSANNPGTVNNSPSFTASAVKPYAGFTLGIYAIKKVSKKSNFTIGINYALLSTSMLIRSDTLGFQSAVTNNTTGSKQFYNHYHFLELPVAFQTTLFSIKKKPLLVEIGLSLSQLIYTNALQFNASTGHYYNDNSLFNSTTVGAHAGLLFALNKSTSSPVMLEPQFYYGLTPVAKSGLYDSRHYSFINIAIRKTF